MATTSVMTPSPPSDMPPADSEIGPALTVTHVMNEPNRATTLAMTATSVDLLPVIGLHAET